MPQSAIEQKTPSTQTANIRARFVLALFRVCPELMNGIDRIFERILNEKGIKDGDEIPYHPIAFGPSEPYLECLESVGLPSPTFRNRMVSI
jgi:hypothetical protein